MTPAEAIAQRAAGTITAERMMDTLMHWRYTFGRCARVDGVGVDAWIRGDWDDVELAFYRDELSDSEFGQVAAYAVKHKRRSRSRWCHWDEIDELFSGREDSNWATDRQLMTDDLHPAIPAADAHAEHLLEQLIATAFTAEEVAVGLGIDDAAVDRMRLDRALWAVPTGHSWRYPTAQFDIDAKARRPIRQVRGVAQVLIALPADLHPLAINGFLHATQPDLWHIEILSPLAWLRGGGAIDAVLRAAVAADWSSR